MTTGFMSDSESFKLSRWRITRIDTFSALPPKKKLYPCRIESGVRVYVVNIVSTYYIQKGLIEET